MTLDVLSGVAESVDGNAAAARFLRFDWARVPRLLVRGEVDLANGAEFSEAVRLLIRDARSLAVLDLGEIAFFGSTALAALIAEDEIGRARGVELVVVASPMVRRVFEITALDDRFELRDS
jgi:anti-anti-sigma factor